KAYLRPDGNVNLFRVEKNAERFNRSAERLAMPVIDVEQHIAAITELVKLEHGWVPKQDGAALYIRPVMLAVENTLEVRGSHSFLHYIILSPVAPYFAGGLSRCQSWCPMIMCARCEAAPAKRKRLVTMRVVWPEQTRHSQPAISRCCGSTG